MSIQKQQTLASVANLKGIGLHNGITVNVTISPAPEGHGIQFKRTDLDESPFIKADPTNIYKTQRHTVLGSEKASIGTVEHLMSAFYALGIDNALVETDAEELPIFDGSAMDYVNAIKTAGIQIQDRARECLELLSPVEFKEGDSEITILPYHKLEITVMVDFDSTVMGPQFADLKSLDDYEKEIAPSRTFVFLHELEALYNAGLAKGGSPDSALVFVENIPNDQQLALLKSVYKYDIEVNQTGLLSGQKLRFNNEAARHKLLDLLGDLALLGVPLKGKIIARKPGHSINSKVSEELRQRMIQQRKLKDIPIYDPNKAPVYDINHICGKLHHRFPFLLVDKIIELSDKHVVSVKNVTMNEPYFPGHFPGNPVMPGVLQIEAMAQTGGILVMENVDEPHSYDTYFLKIDNARFRAKVMPGDTILFRLDLTSPIRRGLVEMKGRAFVGNNLVAEADLLAQIIKRK
jgi:UDP-3-O-[3-hydroxymyristoyl] N-acetylglucosamine deacetylase / 3-hydroxyacyl-[acyl-carrier-protein] dehydratase